jgi:hypothetical protein
MTVRDDDGPHLAIFGDRDGGAGAREYCYESENMDQYESKAISGSPRGAIELHGDLLIIFGMVGT